MRCEVFGLVTSCGQRFYSTKLVLRQTIYGGRLFLVIKLVFLRASRTGKMENRKNNNRKNRKNATERKQIAKIRNSLPEAAASSSPDVPSCTALARQRLSGWAAASQCMPPKRRWQRRVRTTTRRVVQSAPGEQPSTRPTVPDRGRGSPGR